MPRPARRRWPGSQPGRTRRSREGAGGALSGGKRFSPGALYLMLQNRLYRGEVTHKGQIYPGQHEVWCCAMIDSPVFPVSTPEGFYELHLAAQSKDAMKAFVAGHPEFAPFAEWTKTAPWTASYAEEPYNSLNSFIFVKGSGVEHAVRWSLVLQAQVVPI
jgi:hypothetical protein